MISSIFLEIPFLASSPIPHFHWLFIFVLISKHWISQRSLLGALLFSLPFALHMTTSSPMASNSICALTASILFAEHWTTLIQSCLFDITIWMSHSISEWTFLNRAYNVSPPHCLQSYLFLLWFSLFQNITFFLLLRCKMLSIFNLLLYNIHLWASLIDFLFQI